LRPSELSREDQHGIQTAEREGIRNGGGVVPGLLFQAERNVAFGVSFEKIGSRDNALRLQAEYGRDGLQRGRCAKRVAVQGFGRGHPQILQISRENIADGGGFGDVVRGCSRAVGVNDADRFRRELRIGER